MRGRQKAIAIDPLHWPTLSIYRIRTYHVSLGTLVDVMRGDYHSRVAIFCNFHQMIPNAAKVIQS